MNQALHESSTETVKINTKLLVAEANFDDIL